MARRNLSFEYLLVGACAIGGLMIAVVAGSNIGPVLGVLGGLYVVVVIVNRLPPRKR
jgi:hypothetical protein